MGTNYRKQRRDAKRPQAKRKHRGDADDLALSEPETLLDGTLQVELPVRIADVISGVSADIEELTGQAGLAIMRAVMEAEVAHLAGTKGRHHPDRAASRWGCQPGYAVLGGSKVTINRPRVRGSGGKEVPLRSYKRFQSPERRESNIMRMLVNGMSTRRYERAAESFVEGYGISKSSISRECIEASRNKLKELCEKRIDALGRLVALMIDGTQYAGENVIVALGVDEGGHKHVLGLAQGATENSTVVQHLLDDLVDRGLNTQDRMLIVLDGSKALRKAVRNTFGDRCQVQRCQLHKRRNVTGHLPLAYHRSTDQRIRTAYAMKDHDAAKAQLDKTITWLEGINPTAARSLEEGLEETLTLHRLKVPEQLRRSLASTNLIESAIGAAKDLTHRVKRWRGGTMRLRWAATGLLAAEKRFRRIRGYRVLPKLIAELDAQDQERLATESSAA